MSESNLYTFAEQYTTSDSFEVKKLVERSEQHLQFTDMISGSIFARLVQQLISIGKYSSALEIGTFTGFTTLSIAEALPEHGKVVTIDVNPKYQKIALQSWAESPHHKKIISLFVDARRWVAINNQTFDLIYIDANKEAYSVYYDLLLPKLSEHGVLIIDNMYWKNRDSFKRKHISMYIERLNIQIKNDPRIVHTFLPIRDGIQLISKRP